MFCLYALDQLTQRLTMKPVENFISCRGLRRSRKPNLKKTNFIHGRHSTIAPNTLSENKKRVRAHTGTRTKLYRSRSATQMHAIHSCRHDLTALSVVRKAGFIDIDSVDRAERVYHLVVSLLASWWRHARQWRVLNIWERFSLSARQKLACHVRKILTSNTHFKNVYRATEATENAQCIQRRKSYFPPRCCSSDEQPH